MTEPAHEIKAAPCPTCIVCQSPGHELHRGLEDALFGAHGKWSLKKCCNPSCGLVWLDPMPLADEIWKAYTTYYTHSDPQLSPRWTHYLNDCIKRGYWARHYGYATPTSSKAAQLFSTVLYFLPIRRRETDAEIRFLSSVARGRLLDVGCGSGGWMLAMQRRGWEVEGVDFDRSAVAMATSKGLRVRVGSLEEQGYDDESFDAITLSHVIEHVPDPAKTLRECRRILKPNGKIVIVTPNSDSLSHRVFGSYWRGLEPPRHLHIFSLSSMDLLLNNTGFNQRWVRPFIVTSVIFDSLQLKRGRGKFRRRSASHWLAWAATRLFKLVELVAIPFTPSVGDCVLAVASKK